jgi:hypothetical protein
LVAGGLSAIVLTWFVGCASPKQMAVSTRPVLHATGIAFMEGTEPETGVPAANWDTTVEATGQGMPAPNAITSTHKELTAREAAKYVAFAQLVEKLKGTHITQESKVHDMVFAGQQIEAHLVGDLTGVREVKSAYDPATGLAEVTLMVGLDYRGNIVPERLLPIAPLSVGARRARAVVAAQTDALAKLRQQLGEVHVWQEVKVKDLQLSHQEAGSLVEGLLEGVRFEEPTWVSDNECTVEGALALAPADIERLHMMAGPVR